MQIDTALSSRPGAGTFLARAAIVSGLISAGAWGPARVGEGREFSGPTGGDGLFAGIDGDDFVGVVDRGVEFVPILGEGETGWDGVTFAFDAFEFAENAG